MEFLVNVMWHVAMRRNCPIGCENRKDTKIQYPFPVMPQANIRDRFEQLLTFVLGAWSAGKRQRPGRKWLLIIQHTKLHVPLRTHLTEADVFGAIAHPDILRTLTYTLPQL